MHTRGANLSWWKRRPPLRARIQKSQLLAERQVQQGEPYKFISKYVYVPFYLAHLSSTSACVRPAAASAALCAASKAGPAGIVLLCMPEVVLVFLQVDWFCIVCRCAILEDLRLTCLDGLSSAVQAQ